MPNNAMPNKWTRRSVGRLILGAPLAAASAGSIATLLGTAASGSDQQAPPEAPADTGPTPLAKFLAKQQEGLTGEDRDKVRKSVTQLEHGLQVIRDFKIGNDVPPAGTFRALKSKRS
jgi:hypothetical protein